MKELNLLMNAYQQSIADHNTSYTNLTLLQKQRMTIYRKYRECPESMTATEVLAESDKYLQYIQSILLAKSTSQTTYPYVISIASTIHNPTMPYLQDEEKLALINSELCVLDDVLRSFKASPMQAGRKVRYTKDALKDLREIKHEMESPIA